MDKNSTWRRLAIILFRRRTHCCPRVLTQSHGTLGRLKPRGAHPKLDAVGKNNCSRRIFSDGEACGTVLSYPEVRIPCCSFDRLNHEADDVCSASLSNSI